MEISQETYIRKILIEYFDITDILMLCDDMGIDDEVLRYSNKRELARNLVRYMSNRNEVIKLTEAIEGVRPNISFEFTEGKINDLSESLSKEMPVDLHQKYSDLLKHINSYMIVFSLVYDEINEWKELHNLLHDLHMDSLPFCSNAMTFESLFSNESLDKRELREALLETKSFWRGCRKNLAKLTGFASNVYWISDPFIATVDIGPDWYIEFNNAAEQIEELLFGRKSNKIEELPHLISDFESLIIKWMFIADKKLRYSVREIHKTTNSIGKIELGLQDL